MSETVKLIIEIPKEALNLIKTFKGKFICNGYDLIQGVQNGIPLDDVKAEIQDIYVGYRHGYEIMADVLQIFDNIGKAESEDKE